MFGKLTTRTTTTRKTNRRFVASNIYYLNSILTILLSHTHNLTISIGNTNIM